MNLRKFEMILYYEKLELKNSLLGQPDKIFQPAKELAA